MNKNLVLFCELYSFNFEYTSDLFQKSIISLSICFKSNLFSRGLIEDNSVHLPTITTKL